MEELLTSLPSTDDPFLFFLLSALREHQTENGKEEDEEVIQDRLLRAFEKYRCLHSYENYEHGKDTDELHLVHANLSLLHFSSEELKSIVSAEDHNKATLLHHSAKHGWVEIMESLITKHGFDPWCTDMIKQTPLHYAAKHRQYNVFDMLISKHNCDPMCEDSKNRNPLYLAAESGCLDIVKYYMVSRLVIDANVTLGGRRLGHIAAEHGHLRVLKYLVAECKCDVKYLNLEDKASLHYASQCGHMPMVKYLITECKCDANGGCNHKNSKTPVHFAAEYGHFDIVKYLALKCKCNVSYTTRDGLTPLHSASKYGHSDIVKFLIEECKCNPKCATVEGLTPLHYASMSGHLDIVHFLIQKHTCDPNCTTEDGLTPLHYAAMSGHRNIAQFLIQNYTCDPNCTTEDGLTPLNYASKHGQVELVKYFVQDCKCDPSCCLIDAAENDQLEILKFLMEKSKSVDNQMLNHCLDSAIKNRHTKVVQYLYSKCQSATFLHKAVSAVNEYEQVHFLVWECKVDVSKRDEDGKTPLHHAVENKSKHCLKIIQCLLATGKVDSLAKDKRKKTPLMLAAKNPHNVVIQKFFNTFTAVRNHFQVESYVNIFLVGNPGAGKSSLSKVLIDTAIDGFPFIRLGRPRHVKGVKPCTAGIVPTILKHKELGNIIVHDLAGHSEYYSSHTATIENLLEGSGAVFVIVVDATEKEAVTHLQQWLMTVKNEIRKKRRTYECQILVVASHTDKALGNDDGGIDDKGTDGGGNDDRDKNVRAFEDGMQKKLLMLEEKCGKEIFLKCLDCRKLGGNNMRSFFSILRSVCRFILEKNKRDLNLYCDMMYGLLQMSKKSILTLSDIATIAIENADRFVLPVNDGKEILKTLSSLHSTGLICYINLESDDREVWISHHDQIEVFQCNIWVVKDKEVLLQEVDGILFAENSVFAQHGDVPKNGIVPVSIFNKLFPEYDRVMLVSFLLKMGLCNIVPPHFFEQTNLELENESRCLLADNIYLFFPCLNKLERPKSLDSDKKFVFGWCLQCIKEHFFSFRFLHCLLLQLAHRHVIPVQSRTKSDKLKCHYWRNGIHWLKSEGVGILVELIDENQCVLVMMSYMRGCESDMVSLRMNIIKDIMEAQQKYCPGLNENVEAFVIDPMFLEYPIDKPANRHLYSVKKIVFAHRNKQHCVANHLDDTLKDVKEILPHENLSEIQLSIDTDIATQNDVPERNESPVTCTYTEPKQTLGINDLRAVLNELNYHHFCNSRWFDLGLQLGLADNTLADIQANHSNQHSQSLSEDCLYGTLAAWLRGKDEVLASWQSLAEALDIMSEKEIAATKLN